MAARPAPPPRIGRVWQRAAFASIGQGRVLGNARPACARPRSGLLPPPPHPLAPTKPWAGKGHRPRLTDAPFAMFVGRWTTCARTRS